MKPTVKKYRFHLIIVLLLFSTVTSLTLFINEYKTNSKLSRSSQQLNNTISSRILPAINKQKDSVANNTFSNNADSVKAPLKKDEQKTFYVAPDLYKDSLLHALNFYIAQATKYELENIELKQLNVSLSNQLTFLNDTINKQKKIITANGYYRDTKLTAHLLPANRFDVDGSIIYDSSNFKYNYKRDSSVTQIDVVKNKVPGTPFKQEIIQIDNNGLKYSLKQPIVVLQAQFLLNASYRLKAYDSLKRFGLSIGGGLQANTLGINARLADFYNITQRSGSFWQRNTISLQIQKPIRTFKIK